MTKSKPTKNAPSKPVLPSSGGSYVADDSGDLERIARTENTRKPAVKPAPKEA